MGIPDDSLIVASFGRVNQAKRIDVALRAFARMRRHHPNAVYLLVGQVSPYYADLPRLLAGPLGESVIVTGDVPLPRLLELMDLCEVAVNLRHPTGGETSGTCVRLLGLGTPVVVSTGDWFSDIPDGCCARVEPGRFEEEELFAVLDALCGDARLRADMGAAAGRWARRHHALERSVEGYAAFIEETIRAARGIAAPVPPLAPYAPGDVAVEIVVDVAGAAAELGVPDDDALLLPEIASTLVELGLTEADG
jgi:glycosyltransferase involved in cell wall biosynthesis